MTGYQLEAVLIGAEICALLAVVAWATAWRYRAASHAEEARERRREAEAELELARLDAAPTDDRDEDLP